MAQAQGMPKQQNQGTKRKDAHGVTSVFIMKFVSFLLIYARNIAQPQMAAEFDGMESLAGVIIQNNFRRKLPPARN